MQSFPVTRIAKGILAIFAALLLSLMFYSTQSCRRYESRQAANARITAALEATYQSKLAHFQQDLPIGTARLQVEKYLTSQGILFSDDREIIAKLGDEPGDGFACDRWGVYVYFKFGRAERSDEVLPADPLTAISLRRIGHCL